MKRILLWVVLLWSTVATGAGRDIFILKGTIQHAQSDKIKVTCVQYNDNWLKYEYFKEEKQLDKEGHFVFNLPLGNMDKYTKVTINYGTHWSVIYAAPGTKLTMMVDLSDPDAAPVYSGNKEAVAVANFMEKHNRIHGSDDDFPDAVHELWKEQPERFSEAISALAQKEFDFLVENGTGLPVDFIEFWDTNYEYSKYCDMLIYQAKHWFEVRKDTGMYYSLVSKVPAKFNDQLMYVREYRYYAYDIYFSQLQAKGVRNEKDVLGKEYFFSDKLLELAHQNMPAKTEEYVFAYYVKSRLEYDPMKRIEYLMTVFTNRYPKSIYTKFLYSEIDKRKRLSSGAPAIDFVVRTENGKKVHLSDLKGKVVYIDFWASYCKGCIQALPYAKKVREHFAAHDDVVFINIAVEPNERSWKNAIKKYDIGGINILESDLGDSKLLKAYNVEGVPHYFLVDKNGNFATENTPRPNETEKLINTIEVLL